MLTAFQIAILILATALITIATMFVIFIMAFALSYHLGKTFQKNSIMKALMQRDKEGRRTSEKEEEADRELQAAEEKLSPRPIIADENKDYEQEQYGTAFTP